MNPSDLFTVGNATVAIGVLIAAAALTVIYIVINGPKKAKKTAVLYNEWTERLELPPLTNNAALNSKAIEKFFKLIWPKKIPEELDVRQELSGLTQELALDFTAAANEALQPKKSTMKFIYDVDDAASGFIRLFAVEEDGREFKLFELTQNLLLLIKAAYPIAEFAHIDLADDVDPDQVAELQNFILGGSGLPTNDPVAGAQILSQLTERFSGVWLAIEVADDTILFRRQTDDDLIEEQAIPVEVNPFKARLEAKHQAEAEAAAQAEAEAAARDAAWRNAEATRKANEEAARDAAIAAGTVSKYVANPVPFLAAEVEIAADEAELFTLDDEPEVLKSDGIGAPILFCVYSDELLEQDDTRVEKFSELMIASLVKNLGGAWEVEFAEASLTFRKGL